MKTTNWMEGLLFAEYERKRLESFGCTKIEIDKTLLCIYRNEYRELLFDEDWVEGFDSYRNAYLKGEI